MNVANLLNEYRQSHSHPTNKLIHVICVPAITFSTLALLWHLNLGLVGVSGALGQWANGAVVLAIVATLYYATAGLRPLLGMGCVAAMAFALILAIEAAGLPLLMIAGAIFVVAWAVQLYGHAVEGAKPSFFKDVQFLLIGPLFVLEELGLPMLNHAHRRVRT